MEGALRKSLVAICLAGMTLVAGASAAAPAPPQKLVYTVHHSRYGEIGTYTNTIVHDGNNTSVSTEIHIAVSFLGITAFRQEASRQERWTDGRLVYFHGVTSTNGRAVELTGAADGDRFVLKTPDGEVVAPANVRLANPWSPGILVGNAMLTPDRGRLDEVRVTGGDFAPVDVDGRQVRAKLYEVYLPDGRKKYEVDLDEHGTPVQFTTFNADGAVTFSLAG
jgi:uncharacterized protein DUF6134